MEANVLVIVAGIVLSALFTWVPKLREWYDALDNNYQKLIMFLALAVAVGIVYGASCASFTIPGVVINTACNQEGLKGLLELLVAAVVANQTTFLLLPKPTK